MCVCVEGPFYKENSVKSGKIRTVKAEQKRVLCVREESICVQDCMCEKTECTCARESVWERERVCACECLYCTCGVGASVCLCMGTYMCAHE